MAVILFLYGHVQMHTSLILKPERHRPAVTKGIDQQ